MINNNNNPESKACQIMRIALRDLMSEQLETDCNMSLDEACKLALRDIKKIRKQFKKEQKQILAQSRYNLYNM